MAEVVAVEIDIRGTKDIFTLQNAIKATNKEIKQLQKDIQATNDPLERIEKQKAFDKLTGDLVKYRAELKTARTAQANVIRDLQAAETGAGSYRELNAELVKARQRFKELSEAQRGGREGRELVKQIQALDKELKDIDKTLGQAVRQIGFYERATDKLGKVLRRAFVGRTIVEGIVKLGEAFVSLVQQSAETNENAAVLNASFERVKQAVFDFGIAVINVVGKPLAALIDSLIFISSKAIDLAQDIGNFVASLLGFVNIDFSEISLVQFFKDLPALIAGAIAEFSQFNANLLTQVTNLYNTIGDRGRRFALEIQKFFTELTGGDTTEIERGIQAISDRIANNTDPVIEFGKAFEEAFAATKKEQEEFDKALDNSVAKAKAAEAAAQKQKTAYQELQSEVSKLTKEIQDQLTRGVVPSQEKTDELRQKTEQLAAIQEEFNAIIKQGTEEVQDYADGSLADLSAQISELETQQQNLVIGSDEYLATQQQITALEAQRAAGLRILTINSEEYAQAQAQAAKDITATQEELALLEATQQQLLQAQSAEEVKAIQEQLSRDLEALNTDRLQAQLQALKDQRLALQIDRDLQLQEAGEDAAKKEQINKEFLDKLNANQLQQLSIEKSLLDQSVSNFSASEDKKTQKAQEEANKRAEATRKGIETGLQAAAQVTQIIGQALAIEDKAQLARLEKAEEERAARIAGLTDEVNAASGLQQQFLQQQLDEEIKAQEEASKQREQIKKSQAEKEKAIAIVQAIINTALAVTSALTAGPVAGPILAAIAGAAGAVQIAAIASQQFADGGVVDGGNGKITTVSNIPTQSNGDNVLATVRRGEVILNEKQQAALGGSKTFAAIGVPGFANGGLVTPLGSPSIAATTGIGSSSDFAKTLSDISSNTAATTASIANQRVTLNTRDLSQEDEDKQVILNTIS